jgi:hypothetical protein
MEDGTKVPEKIQGNLAGAPSIFLTHVKIVA